LHAAVCYEKAINAGLVNPLDRDLAKQRIQEVRKAAPKAEPAVVKAPQVVLQKATFDPVAFDRIEGERSAEMARFRDAWRRGNSHDYREATQKLTEIRERWVAALDLGNRANNMQGQQGAIAKVLRADGSFADGHLANCYLQMMLGNRAGAAASLKTALDLMQKQPNEQVFCGIQWLDLGRAAIRLGDRKLAEKVRNVFKKMFPNHPGVRLLSALTLRDKRLFAEAEREFEQALQAAPQNSHVAAEFAWCLVSQPMPDDPQDYDRAAELVDQFLGKPSSSAWLFLRAKAALAAKDGRWAEAIQILRAAEAAAPLLYRDDLQKQQQAYEKKSNFKPTP
jgi:tetratricopeptide (TPR) repeat protein